MTPDFRAPGVKRGIKGDNSTVVCSQGKVIQWWTDVSSVSSNANGQELVVSIIEYRQHSSTGKGWSEYDDQTK